METTLGMNVKELLSLETTVSKPSEEICRKILQLKGLLENNNLSSWRISDKKPEIQIYRRKNDSFQSLPALSSSNYSSSPSSPKQMYKVCSADTISSSPRNGSSTKYVSKFKCADQQVEDKILNTIILSKLNKFSESTYGEIRDFLHQILGSSNQIESSDKDTIEEFVKEFMNLVFKKAASEEIFCPLYAKLLGEISKQYPIILDEMNKLHENYLNIFEEEEISDSYDTFVERNREKKYRQGYSQFLSELIVYKILCVDKIVVIVQKIIEQLMIQGKLDDKITLNDQYIDCLLRITKVLYKKDEDFFVNIRKSLFNIVDKSLKDILENKILYKSISTKSRFLLLNIIDYLKNI